MAGTAEQAAVQQTQTTDYHREQQMLGYQTSQTQNLKLKSN